MLDKLTPKERAVFPLLATGTPSAQVATLLGISLSTAKHHKENIFRKPGLHSVDELVRLAAQLGLL